MVKIGSRVNAVHPKTGVRSVGIIISVNGERISVKFSDGVISDFYLREVTVF